MAESVSDEGKTEDRTNKTQSKRKRQPRSTGNQASSRTTTERPRSRRPNSSCGPWKACARSGTNTTICCSASRPSSTTTASGLCEDREEARVAALTEISQELLPVSDAAEKGLATLGAESRDPRLARLSARAMSSCSATCAMCSRNLGSRNYPLSARSFDPSIHEAVITEATMSTKRGASWKSIGKGTQSATDCCVPPR